MRATKPVGQPTRGFTAPNRLRRLDTYLAVAHREQVRSAGLYVDLGYGARPVTTVETFRRLRALNPEMRVLGVELDPERVAAAQPWARPELEYRRGGFNLPLAAGEQADVVRAMNVLRQYEEGDVGEALAALAPGVIPGGLVMEGTCDPWGRHVVFNVYRRAGDSSARKEEGGTWRHESLVFGTRPRQEFEPRAFQAVLPKALIHHAEPGGQLDRFFGAWERAWRATRGQGPARWRFLQAGRALGGAGYRVDQRAPLLERGFLCLGPRSGSPLTGRD